MLAGECLLSGTSDYRRWGLLANSDNVLYREKGVRGDERLHHIQPDELHGGCLVPGVAGGLDSNVFKVKVWRIDNALHQRRAQRGAQRLERNGVEVQDLSISGTQVFDNYQQSLLYGKGQRTKMVDNSTNTTRLDL